MSKINNFVSLQINKLFNFLKRRISPEMFAVFLSVLVLVPILFVNPIKGYSDNGDFWRMIYPNGLYPIEDATPGYVQAKYNIMQYYNENQMTVWSIESIFIRIAIFLNKIFYSKTIFDIRFLSFIYLLLFVGGIYLLTKALTIPVRRIRSYVIAALVVFVFADTSITFYFNSFFQEPISFIAFIYVVASVLLISRTDKSPYIWIIVYFISALGMITASSKNVLMNLVFIIISLGLIWIKDFKKWWPILAGALSILTIAGIFMVFLVPDEILSDYKYDAFTNGVLVENKNPGKEIEKHGIEERYELMRNGRYDPATFAPIVRRSSLVKRELMDKLKPGWTVGYYFFNPKQLIKLVDVVTQNQMIIRPASSGNFVKEDWHHPKPNEQSNTFSIFSNISKALFPRKYIFTLFLFITLIMVYSVAFYSDLRSKEDTNEGIIRFFLIIGLMIIPVLAPFEIVNRSGIVDLYKDVLNIPLAFYFVAIITISDVMNQRLWKSYKAGGSEDE